MIFARVDAASGQVGFDGDAARVTKDGVVVVDWTTGTSLSGVPAGVGYQLETVRGGVVTSVDLSVGYIVVTTGQSNMRGWFTDPVTQAAAVPSFRWNGSDWVATPGAGAVAFASTLSAGLDGAPIAFVDGAVGGTALLARTETAFGYWLKEGPGSLYQNTLDQLKAVGGTADLILWMQGETEASARTVTADEYAGALQGLLAKAQADMGSPPVIIGGLAASPLFPAGFDAIRAGQIATAEAMADVDYVASDLSLELIDHVHLTGAARVWQAIEVAKAAAITLGGHAPVPDPRLAGTDAADDLAPGAGDDVIRSLGGDDRVDGGAGRDVIAGGAGDDLLHGGEDDDAVYGDDGIDTIHGDGGNDVLFGGRGDDVLYGGDGRDLLNGGSGRNVLIGGDGDDTYTIAIITDHSPNSDAVVTNQIVELVGGGFDTVSTSISYTLDVNVEQLILAGNTAIDGTGNDDDNVILGNNGVNVISGLNGDDILRGYGGNDTLYGGAGNDILYGDIGFDALFGGEGDDRYYTDANDTITEEDGQGIDTVFATTSTLLVRNVENLTLIGSSGINGTGNELANIIIGNAAANVLDGGLGADILIGGVGNDTYIVDDAGDVVIERPGEGRDLVKASISWTLGSDLEDLTLTGTADLAGTGNGLANVITGNTGANLLTGGDGNDTLQGGAGADTLVGEAGADYLLGGEGDDLLIGGADNDRLDGGLGADRMQGGAGADTYTVNDAGDIVDETGGDGTDVVNSAIDFSLGNAARAIGAIENLTLTGTANLAGTGNGLANVITGNAGANVLSGGDGADSLLGGAGDDVLAGDEGKDTLTGGAGADSFVFGAASATSTDRVIDFSSAAGDKLVFKAVDYGLNVGQGVDATGQLNADYLEYGASASRSHATFVFNSLTKTLSWDADGAGGQAAVAVAIFTIPTGMAAGDFLKASDVQFVLNRSLPAPSLALRSDTGISASDGITQDGTVVAVPGSPGGSLSYTVDGVAVATYDPTALADGAHTVTVTQTDAAGNVSPTTSLSFVLDRTAPSAPSLVLGSDTGASASDGVTRDATVVVAAGEPGGSLSYTVDGVAVATYDPTALTDGAHTVTVTQTDAAGNVSPTTSLSFVLDRTAPSAPSLVLGSDTGASASDGVTRDATVVVAAGEPGGSLRYTVDGVAVTTYDPTALADGTHTVAVAQTDAAGNVSSAASLSFVLDRLAPSLSISASDAQLTAGETSELTFQFSETISGFSSDSVSISHGQLGRFAKVGERTYTALFTPDSDYAGEGLVSVGGASYADSAGNTGGGGQIVFAINTVATSRITGTAGDDMLRGTASDDRMYGDAGNDVLLGYAGNDVLYGEGGNDQLDGGTGADTMRGGIGDDTYTVENVGDVVDESDGSGAADRVLSSISFDLGDRTHVIGEVEILMLTGTAAINGTGNELSNKLGGNAAANILDGGGGNDFLYGVAGNDTLVGGAGNDRLDGGAGADLMRGGAGDDTYDVDNAGDVVDESDDPSGIDLVNSAIDYTLSTNVENLTLTGTAALHGTGNALANRLSGNGAANVLSGGDGADVLLGNAGDDVLAGDGGKDTLTGGAGADSFVFGVASADSTDRILDFNSAAGDKLVFRASDYGLGVGHGVDASGHLNADYFEYGAAASRSHATFVFNGSSKTLSWDADGAGSQAAVAVAVFTVPTGMAATDFLKAIDVDFIV